MWKEVLERFEHQAPVRHFCTRSLLQGWQDAQAGFIVREHAQHPRVLHETPWHEMGRCDTGELYEQVIGIHESAQCAQWRRIRLVLDTPTDAGEQEIRLWSNLPESVAAEQIAGLYRKRWRIEGLFGPLESVLNSEIRTLGHPRAEWLGFTTAVLAYNELALLKRCIEQAHHESAPELDASTYH